MIPNIQKCVYNEMLDCVDASTAEDADLQKLLMKVLFNQSDDVRTFLSDDDNVELNRMRKKFFTNLMFNGSDDDIAGFPDDDMDRFVEIAEKLYHRSLVAEAENDERQLVYDRRRAVAGL